MEAAQCTLYSGGLKGAETVFGETAEKYSVNEVIFTFEGHKLSRDNNVSVLSKEDLERGNISMELASKMLNRTYYETEKIRKVLQTIFHMVNKGHQVFVVGTILEDKVVKGGTGWGVELGKLFNRPVNVYDQDKKEWFAWKDHHWVNDIPVITDDSFACTGTRNLADDGTRAIHDLFERSFA